MEAGHSRARRKMAYDSRVYRILIASPSDVEMERDAAVKVIQDWNDLHSASRKVTLLPLRWETHTAPEYGTRPQEVVNRMIVDECDLLLGIFWTRIGSPTGAADSGTLEEIDRVGRAKKPIMLYFSSVGADPARLDLRQLQKLNEFREKTFPNGLVESYKSPLEFRDKFAMHLERKVRELQQNEALGQHPLTMEFLSLDTGNLLGTKQKVSIEQPQVDDLSDVPEQARQMVSELITRHVQANSYVPVLLTVSNTSPSSVKSLYIELDILASDEEATLTERPQGARTSSAGRARTAIPIRWYSQQTFSIFDDEERSLIRERVGEQLAKFESDKLQRLDKGWRLSFEWDALQPQRIRVIKPILYVFTRKSAQFVIRARVYADTAPAPFTLSVQLDIAVTHRAATLADALPGWEELLKGGSSGAAVLENDGEIVEQISFGSH
jgi:hypothetical protein